MENNEHLTSLHSRINDEFKSVKKLHNFELEKLNNLESNIIKFSKLTEHNEKEFSIIISVSLFHTDSSVFII